MMLRRLSVYAIGLLMMLVAQAPAFGVEGVVKRVDREQRRLVIVAGGRDHSVRVPASIKVLDAAGRELPEGLKAKDLCEGAGVSLMVDRQGDRLVLQAIRLTGRQEFPSGRSPAAKQTTDPATKAPQTRPSGASSSTAVLGGEWERLPDGSLGQVTAFQGVGGVAIPAYIRKPTGPGPFPVVMLLHGGRYGEAATYGMGRSMRSPTAEIIQAGWAVFSIDYRPTEKISIEPVEFDDTVEAVKALRKMPFVDPTRVGLLGCSHGAQVGSRVVSRVNLQGAILCAPAALDLIEIKKAAERGEPIVSILNKLIADMETQHGAEAEEIDKDPAKFGYSSAITEVERVQCPILIINGRNDDNSPTSVIDVYVEKLRAAGKLVDTYLPDNGPHGFYVGHPEIPETKEAARRAVAFFQQQFGKQRADAPTVGQSTSRARPTQYQYGPMDWVDPDRTEPEGTHYETFHSQTINTEVSYLVYLPPDYEQQEAMRYPVLYYLHASGGTPRRDGAVIVRRLDSTIRAGRVSPMIVIMPNGLRGNTMYCDSRDGQYPVETVIIKDLIPHVDATYRTVASREGRAVEGFSIGGFGAAHFGFKYPELFGVISIQAPPLLGPELTSPLPVRAWSRLFPTAMGGDLEYFRANDPFSLVVENAESLRDRTLIRIVCHVENENWLAPRCEALHQLLMQQMIPHEFYFLSNVKSHNRGQVLDTLGDSEFTFFSSALPRWPVRSP